MMTQSVIIIKNFFILLLNLLFVDNKNEFKITSIDANIVCYAQNVHFTNFIFKISLKFERIIIVTNKQILPAVHSL